MNWFLRNALKVLSQPKLGFEFIRYLILKSINSGTVLLKFPHQLQIGGLNGFSEYRSYKSCLTIQEVAFYERLIHALQANAAKRSAQGIALDVGANVGIISALYGKLAPSWAIHSFEPAPKTFQSLLENLKRNNSQNCRAFQSAVCNCLGTVSLDSKPNARANAHLELDTHSESTQSTVIRVPATTLDAHAQEHFPGAQISLLKVDVEGYETLVFQGAEKLLREKKIQVIVFEVVPTMTEKAGFPKYEPVNALLKHGYKLFRLNESQSLQPVSLELMDTTVFENWIAINPNLESEILKNFLPIN
jgi:FkbM family methyltransferase